MTHTPEQSNESARPAEPVRQLESAPTVWLIYRDNDIYSQLGDIIRQKIEASGYRVLTQVFPRSASTEEIREWFSVHLNKIHESQLVMDQTCENQGRLAHEALVSAGALTDPKQKTFTNADNLDDMLNAAYVHAFPLFGSEGELNPESMLAATFREIVSSADPLPQKLIIIDKNLGDHAPFRELAPTMKPVEKLKAMLAESGMPAELIEKMEIRRWVRKWEGETPPEILPGYTWFIVDRHAPGDGRLALSAREDAQGREVVLRLPLPNLRKDASTAGLIKPIPDEMSTVAKALGDYIGSHLRPVTPNKG